MGSNNAEDSSLPKSHPPSTVLARLQALFPNSVHDVQTDSNGPQACSPTPEESILPGAENTILPRFLKVRIVTWNMHDSLPRGELDDLLGTVPPYEPLPEEESDRLRIPNMNMEDCHPYHVVVVAGQECPTVSGIPMGLAAAFKHKDEKHKEEEKKPNKLQTKSASKQEELGDRERLLAVPLLNEGNVSSASSSTSTGHTHTSGWSWILEEWFCHGLGERIQSYDTQPLCESYNELKQTDSSTTSDGTSSDNKFIPGTITDSADLSHQKWQKVKKLKERKGLYTGPYELLIKERLMGIYIAVFVYRDVKPLVRGFSSAVVPTGLVGRIGNKGGVGVSVDIAGKTFLFVNAHLAAHEDRILDRINDIAKIKAELQVEDFLPQDDPRKLSEDVTNKFDYSFIFGDLNFRLNLTRLHADWLIGRKDYNQALAFDQLREQQKGNGAFVEFKEGPINFPPTFKYDVVKGLKRDKPHLLRDHVIRRESHENRKRRSQLSALNLSEVQEVDSEYAREDANSTAEVREPQRRASSVDTYDTRSMISVTTTTTSSRSRAVFTDGEGDLDDDQSAVGDAKKSALQIVHQEILAKVATKAKDKWLSLITHKDSRPQIRRNTSHRRARGYTTSTPNIALERAKYTQATKSSGEIDNWTSGAEAGYDKQHVTNSSVNAQQTPSRKAESSTKSMPQQDVGLADKLVDSAENDTNCYDTSSKQRVPSWCDRILFKSTVPVESDEEEEEDVIKVDHRSGLGPRMLQFLTQALKPLSSRTRTLSLTSTTVPGIGESPPARHMKLPRSITTSPEFHARTSITASSDDNITSLRRDSLASLSNPVPRNLRTKLMKTRSIESVTNTAAPEPNFQKRGRTQSIITLHISRPLLGSPVSAEAGKVQSDEGINNQQDSPKQNYLPGRSWRLFPFLNKDGEPTVMETDAANANPGQQGFIETKLRPRKGEVCVLGYRSLGDQAMRRLEGRSDHRPVIGSYAIIL